MIASGPSARRWARYLGAPENVAVRAAVYEEHVHREGCTDVRVYDSTGRKLWTRRVYLPKSATRAISIKAGWVDAQGHYLLGEARN